MFLIVYDLVDDASVATAQVEMHHSELKRRFKDLTSIPIMLCGTKLDAIPQHRLAQSVKVGQRLAERIGATFFACSATTQVRRWPALRVGCATKK